MTRARIRPMTRRLVCRSRRSRVERLPRLLQIRRLTYRASARPAWALVTDRGERLVDFMGDRGGELAHRRDAVGVRQLHLRFAVAPLALASFSSARLRSVRSRTNATPSFPLFVETRRADQHGHAAAVFPKILLLERLERSDRFSSARSRASRSRHSGGVRSVQRRRPGRDPRGRIPPCGEMRRWPR